MREQMYEALKDLILTNTYKPTTVLQIDRLADEFGVSATPVREALVRLESDGLVNLIPNKGAQVTDIHEDDIRNTWEMRRLLELYAARTSIGCIKDVELAELEVELIHVRDDPFDNNRYIASDMHLHETLFVHLGNEILKDSIRRVHQMSLRIRYFAEQSVATHDSAVHEVIQEHLAILEALRSRDIARIEAVLYKHLQNGETRTLRALGMVH